MALALALAMAVHLQPPRAEEVFGLQELRREDLPHRSYFAYSDDGFETPGALGAVVGTLMKGQGEVPNSAVLAPPTPLGLYFAFCLRCPGSEVSKATTGPI